MSTRFGENIGGETGGERGGSDSEDSSTAETNTTDEETAGTKNI